MARLRLSKGARGGHVIVLGLGRFGRAFAREALAIGYEVVAADASQTVVDELAVEFPCCVRADSTSRRALESLAIAEAELVLVATGSDIEASVLTVATLADLGARKIWAKASSERHRDILLKVGAHRVTQPETSEGVRLAHQMREGTLEYVPLDGDFTMVETESPQKLDGRVISRNATLERWRVNIVAVKHREGGFSHTEELIEVQPGDMLVITGTSRDIEAFLAGC